MALLPKLRSDLISSPSEVDGATVYTVKDPVGGNYFRLREPEHWLIHQFDGSTTPEQIAERFRAKFNLNITAENVEQFIAVMDKLLFLENSRSEQTTGRFSAGMHTGRSLIGRMLFVRLKAFQPGRLLEWLTRAYRPFHRPFWFFIEGLIILTGLVLLFSNASRFEVNLVELWRLSSIGLLILSIFTLLVLHEFAHAVVCRLHGGEVREMGFLLLYFQPCFYCDLSDAWLFEKKSQRLGVTVAGPYFQLLLLALSVILWRVTVPGAFLHEWAWMLVTVNWINCLFNFNPLIKLDGYYLLSDWLDIPNLRRKAFGYLGNAFQRRVLGWEIEPISTDRRHRTIYLSYSLTALLYSGWLLGYVLWLTGSFLLVKAGPGGLVLFLFILLVILRSTLRRLAGGIVSHIRHMRQLFKKPLKLISYVAVFSIVLVAGLTVPMPQRVSGDVLVRPIAEFNVSLNESGLMEKVTRFGGETPETATDILQLATSDMATLSVLPCVKDGQRVQAGDTIAVMSSNQVTREIETGQAELDRLYGQLNLLNASPKKEEVAEAESQVNAARASLRQLKRDHDRMKTMVEKGHEPIERLESSQAEVQIAEAELATRQSALELLKAPPRPEEQAVILHEIEKQNAQLLFLRQQAAAGQIVTPVTGVARVGTQNRQIMSVTNGDTIEVLVPVSDFDMPLVELGQSVRVKVRSYPDRTFVGRVMRIPASGDETDDGVSFPVTVAVDNSEGLLRNGMSGYAKIETGESSLVSLGFRKLYSTLRIEFWSWW